MACVAAHASAIWCVLQAVTIVTCLEEFADGDRCSGFDTNASCKTNSGNVNPFDHAPAESPWSIVFAAAFVLGIAITFIPYLLRMLDGWPSARLATLGLIPEAWASASVPSICALLRLKKSPTPTITLVAGAVTDKSAYELGEAVREFDKTARTRMVALLNNPALGMDGVERFCKASLRLGSPLEELDLTGNSHFGNAVTEVLAPYIEGSPGNCRQLRELRLVRCGITSEGARRLGAAASNSVLRTLDLSLNSLEGSGPALGELVDAPLLEELILSFCDLNDADLAELAEELPGTHLRSLELSGNAFTEIGLASLSGTLAEAHLVNLSLASNRIVAGNSLGHLATAWAAQAQRRGILRLEGNNLSPVELNTFKELVASLVRCAERQDGQIINQVDSSSQ